MRKLLWVGVVALGLVSQSWAQCPNGKYQVTGWNAGLNHNDMSKASYQGKATIETNGEICQMTWTIAGKSFVGVGFFYPNTKPQLLTMSYASLSEGWFGAVDYVVEGNKLVGTWVVSTKGKVPQTPGKEILTKQ
jgi:hypothetical protein